MTLSAAALAALGLGASFLPQEILGRAAMPADRFSVAVIQLAGALYIAFALLNWSAKGALLGGIYGRPIVLANFSHFAIGAIVLLKIAAVGAVTLRSRSRRGLRGFRRVVRLRAVRSRPRFCPR